MTNPLVEEIECRARVWVMENGLRGPFQIQIQVESWGFSLNVQGLNGSAHCTFQRDGSPSLYERTR